MENVQNTMQIECRNPSELEDHAGRILERIGMARVVGFYGQLGAGKTTLIKSLCRKQGVVDLVTSPSFALVNEYRLANDSHIYHFDFYRIQDIHEVFDLGYEEYFFSGERCYIEWPEKIVPLLPKDTVSVVIQVQENGNRLVRVQNGICSSADY